MTFVLSDLHGHMDRYRAMLERISLSAADTLYVLGDVIDRGPDGVRILLDMMSRPNVVPILGNHELTAAVCLPWLMKEVTDQTLDALGAEQIAALREWIMNGGGPTLRALKGVDQETREEILDYLQDMALYAEVEAGGRSFVLVHSGIENFSPHRPLDAYDLRDFLFAVPNLNKIYYEHAFLIFGHTPTRLLWEQAGEAPSDAILRWGRQIAIDCGCAFGGRLGCLCLETLEEFYV